MNPNMPMTDKPMVCKCGHHKVKPILTILAGVALLLGALNVINWQWVLVVIAVLIIVGGFMKLFSHKCTCCSRP